MKNIIMVLMSCFLWMGTTSLFAQQGNVAAGGDATVSGVGSVSFSIGQPFYAMPSSASFNLVEGLQQPFEISTVTGLEQNVKGVDLFASVYPNPMVERLTLKVNNSKWTNLLSYTLFDMNGKILEEGQVNADETNIQVSHLAPATYFLKVSEGSNLVKTFQILKSY